MSEASSYVLGHSARELKRLEMQSEYWGDATREWLTRAGVTTGMHVVDLGCGGGDVTSIAAELVGPSGRVRGVDAAIEAVEAAKLRARYAGLDNVEFHRADLENFVPTGRVDAVIGRFVLGFTSDAAAVLRRAATGLRDGGIVACLEMDASSSREVPANPLWRSTHGWLRETANRRRGAAGMGPRLWHLFREAGLPAPELAVWQKVEGAPAPALARYLAETVRTLEPAIIQLGVATGTEIGIETLAARLQDSLAATQAIAFSPCAIGAWTRVGRSSVGIET